MKKTLGELCKEYEKEQQIYLDKSKPVFIRIDGKGFSKLTKKMEKPICTIFQKTMNDTLEFLLKEIQGTVCGYQQSDEITMFIDSYSKEDSQLWFGGRTDKLTSVSSSIATWIFNKKFVENITKELFTMAIVSKEREEYLKSLLNYANSDNFRAMFDSRVFQCNHEEVHKMFKWRQLDCYKNSVTGYAQRYFSHKELHGKNTEERKNMLLDKGLKWENEPFVYKYGYVMSLHKDSTGRQKFIKNDIIFEEDKDIYDYVKKRESFEK